jgi:hypothetical protein
MKDSHKELIGWLKTREDISIARRTIHTELMYGDKWVITQRFHERDYVVVDKDFWSGLVRAKIVEEFYGRT